MYRVPGLRGSVPGVGRSRALPVRRAGRGDVAEGSADPPTRAPDVSSSPCRGSASLRMSMRQPVRRAANRAFWPSLPIASDNWKSGTITRAVRFFASSTVTDTTFDGEGRCRRTSPDPPTSR